MAYEEEAEKFQAGYGDFKFFSKISGSLEEYLINQFTAVARSAPAEWPIFYLPGGGLNDIKKTLSKLGTRKDGELWNALKKLCPVSGDGGFSTNPHTKRDAEIMKAIKGWMCVAPSGHGEFLLAQDISAIIRKYSTGGEDTLAKMGYAMSQPFCKAIYKRLETRTNDGGPQSIFPRRVKEKWDADKITRVDLAKDSDGKEWEFCKLGDFCAFFASTFQSMYQESLRGVDLGFIFNDRHGTKRHGDAEPSVDLHGLRGSQGRNASGRGAKKQKRKTHAQEQAYLQALITNREQETELQALRTQVQAYGASNPTPGISKPHSTSTDNPSSLPLEVAGNGAEKVNNFVVSGAAGISQPKLTFDRKKDIICFGCGRQGHTRTICPFGKSCPSGMHKDFNQMGPFVGSESHKRLQACKDGKGQPYNVLQCRLSANPLTGKLDPITVGPTVFTKPVQVPRHYYYQHNNPYAVDCDLTECYSALSREASERDGPGLTGTVFGERVSLLLDTGSSDYNFISTAVIDLWGLQRHTLRQPVRVRSIHSTTTCHEYVIITLTISHLHESYSFSLPCIELSSAPRDVVVGLPTIQEHKLTDKFAAYFAQVEKSKLAAQRGMFPEFSLSISDYLDSQELRVPGAFNAVGPEHASQSSILPYPEFQFTAIDRDLSPSTHPERVWSTDESCNDVPPVTPVYLHSTDIIDPRYTVVGKETLLDHDVAPDVDSMIVEDEILGPSDGSKTTVTDDGPGYKVFGSPQLQRRLRRLLHQYADIFATTLPSEPAKLSPISFAIDKEKWQADKRTMQYPRPQSQEKEEGIEQFIDMALKNGLIRPAPTVPNWSQVVLVLKPNGKEWRFCVDYTVLNQFMENVGWPIPHIGSILRRIAKHKPTVFATMDGTQGFYQLEVEMSSQEFLCFTTFMGNFVFQRAPMGPKTVPALFQRAMAMEVFPNLVHKIMEIYIDDFIVWGKSDDEFITNLTQVFDRLRETNVKINPLKCKFGMEEVEYVGHKITPDGLTFSAEKISEVNDFERPTSQGGLKSFLGMAGYFREHVPQYVDIVHPLGQLVQHYTKKSRNLQLEWTPELIQQFDRVKTAISNVYTLYHRDENAPLRLFTDASSYGIGAYLCQVVTLPGGSQQEQPLAFISKTLTDQEKRWSVYEKEAYAIYYSIKKIDHFLRGHHFTLFTDHRNLTFLNKPPSDKVMRWRLAVQEFGFDVAYIKGELNNVADSMSRCVPGQSVQQPIELHHLEICRFTAHSYMAQQSESPGPTDPKFSDSFLYFLYRENRRHYFPTTDNFSTFLGLLDGTPCSIATIPIQTCLFSNVTDQQHPLVTHERSPLDEQINDIIKRCHNAQVGHGGVERTLQLIYQLSRVDEAAGIAINSCNTIRADVKRFVKQCSICQKVRDHQLTQFIPKFSTSTYGLFDNISMDSIYMPISARGNKYLLVIIDSFSRYVDVYPISNLSAPTAFECLIKFMSNFGIPSHICTDNATQFKSVFEDMLSLARINHYKIQPYSHQENSIVERANKEVLSAIRCLILEHKFKNDWDILCHVAKRIINSRIHSSIGISPAELVFAGQIDLQRGSLFPYNLPENFKGEIYMKTLIKHQELMLRKAVQYQNKVNSERLKTQQPALKTVFPDDSFVLVKPETGPADKLDPRWLGPYQITSRLERPEGDIYTVVHLATNKLFDFRVDRLKPFDFDPHLANPFDAAMMDFQGDVVESVLGHKFEGTHTADNLRLKLKWLGNSEIDWFKFSDSLAEVGVVHEYFRRFPSKLLKFIPRKFQDA